VKLPAVGEYQGMPVSVATLRKERRCKGCWAALRKGEKAYRPILFAAVNGILRCDRICPSCMKEHGRFLAES
jgi:hypothetical protein